MRSITRSAIVAAAFVSTAFVSAHAAAQHSGDVFLSIQNSQINTGAVLDAGEYETSVFVFTGQFGDSGSPLFTSNPGFDCLVPTFQPGTKIGFDILDALRVWDGQGFVETGGERLKLQFLTASVTTGNGPTPGFELSVQPNGGFHRHYSMFLLPPNGGVADPGVYLLARTLYSTAASVAPSDPFYLLVSYNATALERIAAQEFLIEYLSGGREKEPHFDVWLRPVDGALFTGAISEGAPGEPIAEDWRVFGAELGEDPDFPFSAVEPGIQLLESEATQNQVLAFEAVDGMRRWDGEAFVPTPESMLLGFGPESVIVGADPTPGFNFSANAEGFIHDHFDHTLLGVDGADPGPGIYLLSLSIEGVAPVLSATAPFYYVFNLGQSEEDHEAAIAYADLFVACAIDLDGDGQVDGADLGVLLSEWELDGASDLNRDGIVDGADLGILLANWGFECAK